MNSELIYYSRLMKTLNDEELVSLIKGRKAQLEHLETVKKTVELLEEELERRRGK